MNGIMVTEKVREDVYSILTEVLGEDATGIYVPVVDSHKEAYSTITEEGYGREIEETDDVTIEYGASRFVIIPCDLPYVIKLSITGLYDTQVTMCREPLEDEEEGITEDFWLTEYNRLAENGTLEDENWVEVSRKFLCYKEHTGYDLMEYENDLCYEAEEDYPECADMLLENTWVGRYNGISVWIQRKVEGTQGEIGDYSQFTSASKEEQETVYKSYEILWDDELDNDFILAILRKYGPDITEKAMRMMNALGLSDLHASNVGYLRDGSPVLLDYGGYSEHELWK